MFKSQLSSSSTSVRRALLAIALLGGVLAPVATATSASATSAEPVFSYEVLGRGTAARITGCSGCSSNLLIPATIQDEASGAVLSVTNIGSGAFLEFGLTSVQIPNSVTNIENEAFYNNSLSSVTIPSSVNRIAIRAFAANNLSSLAFLGDVPLTLLDAFAGNSNLQVAVVPSNANGFGTTYQSLTVSRTGAAFNRPSPVFSYDLNQGGASVTVTGCSANCVAELVVPSSLGGYPVTVVGEYAFMDDRLSSVVIPSSVTSVLLGAFGDNSGLTSVTFLGNAPTDGGSIFYYDYSLKSVLISSTSSGWSKFFSGKKVIDENGQVLPGAFTFSVNDNQSTATITGFSDPEITHLVIPSSVTDSSSGANLTVTNIGNWGFLSTAALSITIPASVTSIGEGAFAGATALTSITIPAGVTSIGIYAFGEASLLKYVNFLGNAPASVGESAFGGIANGAKAHISATATGYGTESTWNGLDIDRATYSAQGLEYSLDDDGNATVTGCVGSCPAELVIPATLDGYPVRTIANWAFQGRGLTSVTLPDSLLVIGFQSFQSNSLTSVTIPNSVIGIQGYAFEGNALTSVTIPGSVEDIGGLAFANNALTTVYFRGDAPTLQSGNLFDGNSNLTTVDVAYGTTGWAGAFSGISIRVAPRLVPASAPKIVTIKLGNGRATLGIWAPRKGGSTPITGYEYTTDDGATWTAVNAVVTAYALLITGLDNGTRYTIKVRAVNGAGGGAASNARAVKPRTVADAPTITALTGRNGSIKVEFDVPASNGGSTIIRYAYSVNGKEWFNWGASTSPQLIKALSNGVVCSIRVRALNGAGWGAISEAVAATPHK